MLHFVQHDESLLDVILMNAASKKVTPDPVISKRTVAPIFNIQQKKAPAVRGLSVISSESLYDRYACGLGSLGTLFNYELHALAFI
jgi:hypothetical protein